jgi:hypothetical protein
MHFLLARWFLPNGKQLSGTAWTTYGKGGGRLAASVRGDGAVAIDAAWLGACESACDAAPTRRHVGRARAQTAVRISLAFQSRGAPPGSTSCDIATYGPTRCTHPNL